MYGLPEQVVFTLRAYRDGTLPPEAAAKVEAHLKECGTCRKALTSLRQGKEVAVVEADPAWRVFFPRFWAAAGVILLLLAGASMYVTSLKAAPFDLRVLGQSEWLSATDAALHVRVIEPEKGLGIAGVPVTVELHGQTPGDVLKLADAKTGEDGSVRPRFKVPDWSDGKYALRVVAKQGSVGEDVTEIVELRRSWRLMVSTEKPLHQPGQTIRMRAIALQRPDLRPVGGQALSFSVTDPKGNVILRMKGVTSAHGIGSADCPLAGELIEGPYRVECKVGNASHATTVDVKTYVLPKFQLGLELDRPYYQPGQTLKGKVTARYHFGKPVAGGQLKVLALGSGTPPKVFPTTASPVTNADGVAEFSLAIPEFKADEMPERGIRLQATLTDTAGQSQSREATATIADGPIRIDLFAEGGSLVAKIPNTLYVVTTYNDGRPAKTRVSVTGIKDDIVTDERGVGSAEITPAEPLSDYENTRDYFVQANDEKGAMSIRKVSLRVGVFDDNFLVRTDRAVYRGGETLTLKAVGLGGEPVFVDVIRDGQTLFSESIPIEKGHGEVKIPLPADLSGALRVCAYRYPGYGEPVRKSRLIYVRPKGELKVATAWDRPGYSPGEHATLTLTLTDADGKPAPGALSLAAVDEAVYSLKEATSVRPRAFFTMDPDLFKSISEVRAWSPDEATRDGVYEQALFAAAALKGDESLFKGLNDLERDEVEAVAQRVRREANWQVLARRRGTPEELIRRIRSGGGTHTLAVSTYPEKEYRLSEIKRTVSGWIGAGMILLLVAAGFVGAIWCLVHIRGFVNWLVAGFIIFVLIGLLLPAVQSARHAARDAQAMNDLRNLELAAAVGPAQPATPPRVRQFFPETLLWRPEVVTDDQGRASVDLDLADSITTWRLDVDAVTKDGRLGSSVSPLRVFQPFFVDLDLPPALTRGDEVAVPVVVSNYLDKVQKVTLTLRDAPWFERGEDASKTVELKPGEVTSARFRIRVKEVGRHEFEVAAKAEGAADAVRRSVVVRPDGRLVERSEGGTLRPSAAFAFETPAGVVPGSVSAVVKLYPSAFSQLVEGIDAIFQKPYGCFEQTSSTTYPNVLALEYLRRTGRSAPAVEAKAREYIHQGYQRLLSFEIQGGGFDWFGRPPANRILTAYGLMEFRDMARVHDVDPALLDRTRRWLLSHQQADGSWLPESNKLLHEDPTAGASDRINATAYVAWAAFGGGDSGPEALKAKAFLTAAKPETISDPYTLALIANALMAISSKSDDARPYLDRLLALKKSANENASIWWERPEMPPTVFHGSGRAGDIETTATAVLALLAADRDPLAVRGALTWLASHKDALGTWGSTQATVLALKALTAGTGMALGADQSRRIAVHLDGKPLREINVPADQSDVVQQLDLSAQLAKGPHRLTLTDHTGTDTVFQVAFRYHLPADGQAEEAASALKLRVDYDRASLKVGETVKATATLEAKGPSAAPMVVVELPIPPGFAVERDDLSRLLDDGRAAKFQTSPSGVVLYLRELSPSKPMTFPYRLRATMPATMAVPAAKAYEYYTPDRSGTSRPAQLIVNP